jgi:hypothetical protein
MSDLLELTMNAHGGLDRWREIKTLDEKGLLQRVDYVTDVLAGIAAHYCYDHISFGGIVFPTLRRVVTRKESQSLLSNRTAVLLLLSDIFVA